MSAFFIDHTMSYLNVEIKAHCNNPEKIRKYLLQNGAEFIGIDHQTDTYFNVQKGRLKLREGNIENNLIYYERDAIVGPKNSKFQLIKVNDILGLKEVLLQTNGLKVVINKVREIYFIRNVKFHIDEVLGLGSFVEIEASNLMEPLSQAILKEQCDFYMKEFGIATEDLIENSYSDMLLDKMQ